MPRKHKFITECIEAGELILTVWPTDNEINSKTSKEKYLSSIDKIGNDPRVVSVTESSDHQLGFVFRIANQYGSTD